jgi:predicted ATPase
VLQTLSVQGFKSLTNVSDITLPRLTVLFGPNAAGKSNLIDAIQVLSRLAMSRTLSDAFSAPVRGYPLESFSFPAGGMSELLQQSAPVFGLEATLRIGKERYVYRVSVRIAPASGSLMVENEYLAALTAGGVPKGNPVIEKIQKPGGQETESLLRIRRKSKPAHPREEPIGLNHTILSDPRLGGPEYRAIDRCRAEIAGWRTYYLDPRIAMRQPRPPAAVQDIGTLGEHIAPFLYHLRSENKKRFDAVFRTLRTIVPAVEELSVDLDERRGTLDILVRQNGTDFSSRIISEGTLRILALSAMAANPWSGPLLAFEEPENGVHPRRLELIADLLLRLCVEQEQQIVITTHSPLLCSIMLKRSREDRELVRLFQVRQTPDGTEIVPFDVPGTLLDNQAIAEALSSESEDAVFEGLVLRGLIDE